MIAPHSTVWLSPAAGASASCPPAAGISSVCAPRSLRVNAPGSPDDSDKLGTEPDFDERVGSDLVDHLPDLWLSRLTSRGQAGIVLRDRRAAQELALLDQHRPATNLCDPLRRTQPTGSPADDHNRFRGHS